MAPFYRMILPLFFITALFLALSLDARGARGRGLAEPMHAHPEVKAAERAEAHPMMNKPARAAEVESGDQYRVRANPNYEVKANPKYQVNQPKESIDNAKNLNRAVNRDVNRDMNRDAELWDGADFMDADIPESDEPSSGQDTANPQFQLETDTSDDVNTSGNGPSNNPEFSLETDSQDADDTNIGN